MATLLPMMLWCPESFYAIKSLRVSVTQQPHVSDGSGPLLHQQPPHWPQSQQAARSGRQPKRTRQSHWYQRKRCSTATPASQARHQYFCRRAAAQSDAPDVAWQQPAVQAESRWPRPRRSPLCCPRMERTWCKRATIVRHLHHMHISREDEVLISFPKVCTYAAAATCLDQDQEHL